MIKQVWIAILLFLITSVAAYNQNNEAILFRNNQSHIVYVGLENPLYLDITQLPDVNQVGFELDTSVFEIRKDLSLHTIYIKPKKFTGPFVEFELKYGDTSYLQRLFVSKVPAPIAFLNYPSEESISLGALRVNTGLKTVIQNLTLDIHCEIRGMIISWVSKDGTSEKVIIEGFKFNENAYAIFEKVMPDDILIFENIHCLCPGDEANRRIRGFALRVE